MLLRFSYAGCLRRPSWAAFPKPRTCARPVVAAHSAVSSSLISVLKDELKYERENYRKDESLLESPPNGFEVENTSGKKAFYLVKPHKNELIVIEVDLDAQPSAADAEGFEEEEEEEDAVEVDAPVKFFVTISKDASALKFECESDGDYVVINHIAHESLLGAGGEEGEEGDDDDEDGEAGRGAEKQAYTGPVFDELDDTLQQAFLDYLEERGVTGELGGYLKLMAVDKTAMEYQAWLGRVKDFVEE